MEDKFDKGYRIRQKPMFDHKSLRKLINKISSFLIKKGHGPSKEVEIDIETVNLKMYTWSPVRNVLEHKNTQKLMLPKFTKILPKKNKRL